MDELINKMQYIDIVEYYSALKMNEILIHAKIWMNLEGIMLSEISQKKKEQIFYDSTYMRYLE